MKIPSLSQGAATRLPGSRRIGTDGVTGIMAEASRQLGRIFPVLVEQQRGSGPRGEADQRDHPLAGAKRDVHIQAAPAVARSPLNRRGECLRTR